MVEREREGVSKERTRGRNRRVEEGGSEMRDH